MSEFKQVPQDFTEGIFTELRLGFLRASSMITLLVIWVLRQAKCPSLSKSTGEYTAVQAETGIP